MIPIRPAARHVVVFGTAAAVSSFAATPSPTVGAEIGIGARVRTISIEVSARVETMPQPVRASGDRVAASVLGGAVIPCVDLGEFSACAVARLGTLQGYDPDVIDPTLQRSLFAAEGLRAGWALGLTPSFALRGTLEGEAAIVRTSLLVDHAPVWMSPPVLASIALRRK